jgi:hypothetical protein
MDYRLNELIERELKELENEIVGLSYKRVRLGDIAASGAVDSVNARLKNKNRPVGAPVMEMPSCDAFKERRKLLDKMDFDYIEKITLYEVLQEMAPNVEMPSEFDQARSEFIDCKENGVVKKYFKSQIVLDYFVDRKVDDVEKKTSGYSSILAEINEDPELNGFGKVFRESFKRLQLELRNTRIKALDEWTADGFPLDDPSYVSLALRETEMLDRYYTKAKEIRKHELVLDTLTRVFEEYKSGFK